MAQDSHDHHDHAHGDDHAHLEDHHHEGPIVITEVVPEKSPEDGFLLGILSLCFVGLLFTFAQWATIKADAHHLEGVEHEQTLGTEHAAPAHVETVAPASHEVAPGPEGAPVAPATTIEGEHAGPDPAGTEGTPVAPGSNPAASGTVPVAPADGAAPGAPAVNPVWSEQPADPNAVWSGTQTPSQPATTPATTEANH